MEQSTKDLLVGLGIVGGTVLGAYALHRAGVPLGTCREDPDPNVVRLDEADGRILEYDGWRRWDESFSLQGVIIDNSFNMPRDARIVLDRLVRAMRDGKPWRASFKSAAVAGKVFEIINKCGSDHGVTRC